ncbi:MAG: prepilin peptidase, partial [Thermodesulfobacteriota bacterium]|nr:prepilin peptidase [Thermodesulfobacteriota bacterium]
GVLFTIFAGSLLGTIAGIMIMILTKIADSKLRIPFGPYLSAGAVIYIFFGKELTQWYFGIIL